MYFKFGIVRINCTDEDDEKKIKKETILLEKQLITIIIKCYYS